MGVLGFIAVFVLLVLIAKQWCLNVKETLKAEVQEEYEEIIRSGSFFCRKVHPEISKELLKLLRNNITQ